MKNAKKTIAILLSLCMVFALLAGCNNSADKSSTPPADNTQSVPGTDSGNGSDSQGSTYLRDKITVSSYKDGGSFDPFGLDQWGSIFLEDIIYQHLVNVDKDGTLYYEVAESFEKVDDTHYTLKIRDGIHDSAGNPLNADDIIWCFDTYIEAGGGGAINKFDHFEKIDDLTLTWVCSSPFTAGELEKNLSNTKICTQAAYEAAGNDMTTAPVGTGPYKLESYTPGSTVVLVADENFWMNEVEGVELSKWDMQNVREIEYQIILDASSRAVALEMGIIDVADTLDAADIDAFADNPDIAYFEMPQDPPVAFIFNCSDSSPCADENLRKAICYALDNDAIAAALAVPATAVYGIAPRMWDAPDSWSEGREYYDFDLETAQALVDASSYNGETLEVQYVSSSAFDGSAIMLQAQLSKIGIKTELLALEDSIQNQEPYASSFDIRFKTFGGGNYMAQVLKGFTSEDASKHLDGGVQIMLVVDDKLDEFYNALATESSEETATAWDEYFTFEKCYGYAICGYSDQACCRSDVTVVQGGTRSWVFPNACS